jgi:hypothetical protein
LIKVEGDFMEVSKNLAKDHGPLWKFSRGFTPGKYGGLEIHGENKISTRKQSCGDGVTQPKKKLA